MNTRYFDAPLPRLFGHRGSCAEFPENTLPAFADAVAAGMPYLELDIHATADAQAVVLHDASLLRTCGVDRNVAELTLAEVQSCDAGATFSPDGGRSFPHRDRGIRISTLEEILRTFPDALFNIELKQDSDTLVKATLEIIRRTGMEDRVLLAAEKDAVMCRLRPSCTARGIPTSFCYGELVAFFDWLQGGCKTDYAPPAAALQIPETYQGLRLVTPQTVAAAHALGVEVHVWTVNEAADMLRLLGLGVDGLMSDRPWLLRKTCVNNLTGGD
ncbi:glycerophosphodiester phosphodiesterase [Syntrophotalea acetylenica]|uniref:glycerophosphodiester phosphodiesterase n=1 Tax=Syntrophotalea acetylenica TaxID=29542 RepID=UPI002A359F62|nr:glycerophosphodiester phosphodiesterase [Syntrophotalea acetylenica]MDY0262938.1 glycerophosphodiester phosphodiesterase [Syntrophotalea acetylenica]